jgi:DNA-binding response OmpR family regulator
VEGDVGSSLFVLLVEGDGTEEQHSMRTHLANQGCVVSVIHNPQLAVAVAYAEWPDLIVVNEHSGIAGAAEMCSALDHCDLGVPRLVVSDNEADSTLRAHAHLAAPFTARRLTLRIKKALGAQAERFLRVGDVSVDSLRRKVKCRGSEAHLTPKEMGLLSHLMKHAGEEVSRTDIMREVWETGYTGDTRTVEVHIRWLRRKIEEDPKRPQHIITVRRLGYRFQPLAEV